MSAADNIDKPDDSQAQTEGEAPQDFADASLGNQNQSDSPTAPERSDGVEDKEDLEAERGTSINRKRKSSTSCQICQTNLKNEKPYYQASGA
jgi:hypothetical protein